MNEIKTVDDLIKYIWKNLDKIYVREKLPNGKKYGSYSLAELPTMLAMKHILRFLFEGTIPVIVK